MRAEGRAQACSGVREPSCVAVPSIPLTCRPACLQQQGEALTLWNACRRLSAITTCCCPILPALYCLGSVLDKRRKAPRFMGLGVIGGRQAPHSQHRGGLQSQACPSLWAAPTGAKEGLKRSPRGTISNTPGVPGITANNTAGEGTHTPARHTNTLTVSLSVRTCLLR